MDKKFTKNKNHFGICKEFEFQAEMDIKYQLQLENLNNTNKFSIVDFKIPNINAYIELKSRTCKSTAFATTLFDKAKVDRWCRNNLFKDAVIFIAFAFQDGSHYFIKYNDLLFDSFEKTLVEEWNQINYNIPLSKCISTSDFINEINELKSNSAHVN